MEKRLFLTSLKQTCNEYLYLNINKCKLACLENRKHLHALHMLPSRMVGWNELCNPATEITIR